MPDSCQCLALPAGLTHHHCRLLSGRFAIAPAPIEAVVRVPMRPTGDDIFRATVEAHQTNPPHFAAQLAETGGDFNVVIGEQCACHRFAATLPECARWSASAGVSPAARGMSGQYRRGRPRAFRPNFDVAPNVPPTFFRNESQSAS